MKRVRILDEASQEATEAAAWYEREEPGLGVAFYRAVEAALDIIEEALTPLTPLPESGANTDAKRLILNRFPYDIIVLELPGEAIVIAVAHQSRKPGYWQGRIEQPHKT